MTANEFAAWLALMKDRHGWLAYRCAEELGCDKNTIKRWRERGAPQTAALACAAIAAGLGPWRPAGA